MRTTRHIRHTIATAALVCLVATTLTAPTAASGIAGSSGPVARAATVAEVDAALAVAEANAAVASTRAIDAGVAAERARADADAAAQRAAELLGRHDAATHDLDTAVARAGAVASTRYRDAAGGALLGELLTAAEPDNLLTRLALLDRIDAAAVRAVGAARESADVVRSLAEQAEVADAELRRLAAEADAEAARAQAAADAEAQTVAAAQTELDALYAQLATLQRTNVAAAKANRLDRQTADQPAAGVAAPAPATPSAPQAPAPPTTPAPPPPPAPPPSGSIMSPAQAQAHARGAIGAYGWGDDQFSCLVSLWNRESGWRVQARNPSSGAYGIPQAYPAEKLATAGADWRTSAPTQIAWGLSYIKGRYGSPCGAWAHSERVGWY